MARNTPVVQPHGRSSGEEGLSPADERRRQVIAGAASLFDEAGYSSTTVSDIAHAVGLRKATLYHYFSSKDEILVHIHEEFIDLLIDRHRARLATRMSASQRLLEMMGDILELMETHRGHVRVFIEHHRELPDEARSAMVTKRDLYEQFVEDEIQRGIDAGEFRPVDVRLASFALFGMCSWAYQWYRPGRLRTREIAYVFWDVFLHGIATPVPVDSST